MVTFCPDQRLHSPGEFSVVLKRRGAIRGSCFDLHHLATGANQPRLGLVISKRFARKSVLRNLIKRQIREIFRQHVERLPPEDFVFRLARPLSGLPLCHGDQRLWVRMEISVMLAKMVVGGK